MMPKAKACFASSVCLNDDFIELPTSVQALYYRLGFDADNDGAIVGIKTIVRGAGASMEDVQLLADAELLIQVEGVWFITDWWVNNKRDKSHYRPGDHIEIINRCFESTDGEIRAYRLKADHESHGRRTVDSRESSNELKGTEMNIKELDLKGEAVEANNGYVEFIPCPECGAGYATSQVDENGVPCAVCPQHGVFYQSTEADEKDQGRKELEETS